MVNGFGSKLGGCEVGILKTCSQVQMIKVVAVGGELQFNGQRHD